MQVLLGILCAPSLYIVYWDMISLGRAKSRSEQPLREAARMLLLFVKPFTRFGCTYHLPGAVDIL